MIPDKNDPFWEKVLAQKPNAQSLGLRLILDKVSRNLDHNELTKEEAIDEIVIFFEKYKKLGAKEIVFMQEQIQ